MCQQDVDSAVELLYDGFVTQPIQTVVDGVKLTLLDEVWLDLANSIMQLRVVVPVVFEKHNRTIARQHLSRRMKDVRFCPSCIDVHETDVAQALTRVRSS